MQLSPVGKVSVSARSTERLPEHATCQIAGTRNGYVSGGAPVGEDFPRTRIREEKARYGGVLERSGASCRNRWRRAPWILRRRLWFHLATGWPGGSSVAIPGHFTNDSGEARLGGRFAPTSRGASAEAGRRRCDGPRGVALHGLEERAAVDRLRHKAVAPHCETAPPVALRGVGREGHDRPTVTAGAKPGGGAVPVKLRHLHVHEDHVEGRATRRRLGGELAGAEAVLRLGDLCAGLPEIEGDQPLDVRRVLRQQDAAAEDEIAVHRRRCVVLRSGIGRALAPHELHW